MDSRNDAAENIGRLLDSGCFLIIKRKLRRESKEDWLDKLKSVCKDVSHPREGKDVYIGTTWKGVSWVDAQWTKRSENIRIVYEIIERTIDKNGQFFLPSQVDVDMYWDNTGLPDREVIGLYHAHGESEQYHSEFKIDMDVEQLPSGKFATNCLVMELAMMAYNILRMIGQESLGVDDSPIGNEVGRRHLADNNLKHNPVCESYYGTCSSSDYWHGTKQHVETYVPTIILLIRDLLNTTPI